MDVYNIEAQLERLFFHFSVNWRPLYLSRLDIASMFIDAPLQHDYIGNIFSLIPSLIMLYIQVIFNMTI